MTTPEDALEEARNALERMRAEGAYAPDLSRAQDREPRPVAIRKLLEWALIEPDTSGVRSTRRLGAPITAVKRGLLRLLRQYHAEILAEQSRFNVNLVLYARSLEDRIHKLEQDVAHEKPEP